MPQDKKFDFQPIQVQPTPQVKPPAPQTQAPKSNFEFYPIGTPDPNSVITQLSQNTYTGPVFNPIVSSLGWAVDKIIRGQYASAKFFDSNADDSKTTLDALADAANEFWNAKEKLSFSDVIKKNNPDFAEENPTATSVLGFVLDIALDPLSWLGVGLSKKGVAIAGKTLSSEGTQLLKTSLKFAENEKRFIPATAAKFDIIQGIEREIKREAKGLKPDVNSAIIRSELYNIGYYDHLKNKVDELRKFTKSNGVSIPDDEIVSLAQKEVIQDLKTQRRLGYDLELSDLAKEKTRIKKNTYQARSPELQQMLSEMDNNLFQNMKSQVSAKGDAGIGVEKTGRGVNIIERNKEGEPIGILRLDLDLTGNTVQQSIAVAVPKQGIGTRLFNYAKEQGYDVESASGVSGYSKEGAAFAIARAEKKFPNVYYNPQEVYELAENRIQRIAQSNPDLKLFEPDGLRLTVGAPFGKTYDIPKSREALKAIGADYLVDSVKALGEKLGATKLGGAIGRTFVRKFDPLDEVPKEFWEHYDSISNTLDSSVDVGVRLAKQLVKLPEERRTVIGKLMADIRDESALLEEGLIPLSNKEAQLVRSKMIAAAKITPEETAIVSQLFQNYNKMAELELRAKLLNDTVTNYSPRKWQLIKDGTEFNDIIREQGNKLSTGMSSSKQTKYKTLAEGVAEGNVPELDAAVLYAQRLISHREKMAVAHFNEGVRTVFGLSKQAKKLTPSGFRAINISNQPLTDKELSQLPKVVQSNMRMLGDSIYPHGMNDELKYVLDGLEKLNSWWKKPAYSWKIASGPRQAITNPMQASLVQGVKVFKVFDARVFADAGLIFFDRGKQTKTLPDFIRNFFTKYAPSADDAILAQRMALDKVVGVERLNDFSTNFKKVTALGQEYEGKFLADWAQQNGVMKGFDQTGDAIKTKVERALARNTDSIASVAGELARFWKWPAIVEDYNRMAVWLNGISIGHSPAESLKMVNKTLFDYSHGLSYMEKNVIRKIIPFYTYQRFAIPLVLKSAITKPGNILTGQKFLGLLEKLVTDKTESLSPSEQESIAPYVLEQPKLYTGFDKDGKANFNILNNMTPLDSLNLLVYDKNNELDWKRTMEKVVLAQVTPFIKVPLELIEDKNFFTGQTLDKARRLGDINDSTLSIVIPDRMKELMGWDNRIHPITGKQTVYVTPWLAHTATSFVPVLKQYVIDPSEEGNTPLENAMALILGTQKVKMDLKEQSEFKALSDRKDVKEMRAKIRTAYAQGSTKDFERYKKDLQDLIQAIQQRNSSLGEIRGQGMNPTEAQKEIQTQDVQFPELPQQ